MSISVSRWGVLFVSGVLAAACAPAADDDDGKAGAAGATTQPSAGTGGTNAGGTDAGGTNAGGSDAGGADAGGSAGTNAGGSDVGGSDAGGSDAGGSDAGGSDAGGSDAGGSDAGGAAGTSAGGTDAGGAAGSNAGGSDAGGSAGSSAAGSGGTDAGGSGGTDAGGAAGASAGGAGGGTAAGWTKRSNDKTDIGGNRTDALWVDADGTIWTGFGTTTEGYGLFRGDNLGATWARATDPDGVLAGSLRVNGISRQGDLLYLAAAISGFKDISFNTKTLEVAGALESSNQVDFGFEPKNFLVTASGAALTHSRTAGGLLVRPDASAGTDPTKWTNLYSTGLFADAVTYAGKFYGIGKTNDTSRLVFVPTPGGTVSDFTPVQLGIGLGQDAELKGLAVDAGHAVVAGFNGTNYTGVYWIASTSADLTAPASWVRGNFSGIFGDATAPTRPLGVCVAGDKIAIVGDQPKDGSARVALSTDGGKTFSAISPSGAGPVDKCQFAADGTLVVAGAGGYVALYK